jgi:hypothetical protein
MTADTATTAALGQPIEDVKDAPDSDMRLWSVTTIIGCLDKPALLYWAAEQTAIAALKARKSLDARVAEEGEEPVIKWLRDARFRRPKDQLSASSLGSVAHAACEDYALTGVRPDNDTIAALLKAEGGNAFTTSGIKNETPVVNQMLDRFDNWLARFQPSYQATEVVVYHPEYGYAGTTDAFLTIDGVRCIVDYKSSRQGYDSKGSPKTPYPEQVGIQLAAYRWAKAAAVWRPRRTERFRRRYYLLNDAERDLAVPVPEVDGGLVIQLTPDHCEAFPIRCDEEVFRSFLYTIEAARWVNETSKTVMGTPLVAGGTS